jgi:hypothetical protein
MRTVSRVGGDSVVLGPAELARAGLSLNDLIDRLEFQYDAGKPPDPTDVWEIVRRAQDAGAK